MPNTSTSLHSVSVAAVIVDDQQRALAIKRRDTGRWEPPGGVLEPHEPIERGLIREVHEETGLDIEPEQLTGVYKNVTRGIVALVFRCRALNTPLRSTSEAAEISWLTQAEITDRMDEAYAIRMLDGLQDTSTPKIRTHDGTRLLE